jgi:hypothetical protein
MKQSKSVHLSREENNPSNAHNSRDKNNRPEGFSDLKFKLLPKLKSNIANAAEKYSQMQGTMNNQNAVDVASEEVTPCESPVKHPMRKYDSLLSMNRNLSRKIDVMHRKNYEKFLSENNKHGFNTNSVHAFHLKTSRISRNKESNIFNTGSSTARLNLNKTIHKLKDNDPQPFLETEEDAYRVVHRSTLTQGHTEGSVYSTSVPKGSRPFYASLINNPKSTITLFPEKEFKSKLASSLASLQAALQECLSTTDAAPNDKSPQIPSAEQYSKLFAAFSSMANDDSYHSTIMNQLVSLLQRGIFVNPCSKLQTIVDVLQIKNPRISSLFLLDSAGEDKVTHFECIQEILEEFSLKTREFKDELKELKTTIYSR